MVSPNCFMLLKKNLCVFHSLEKTMGNATLTVTVQEI